MTFRRFLLVALFAVSRGKNQGQNLGDLQSLIEFMGKFSPESPILYLMVKKTHGFPVLNFSQQNQSSESRCFPTPWRGPRNAKAAEVFECHEPHQVQATMVKNPKGSHRGGGFSGWNGVFLGY